jgi:hypothetical protein
MTRKSVCIHRAASVGTHAPGTLGNVTGGFGSAPNAKINAATNAALLKKNMAPARPTLGQLVASTKLN